MAVQTPPRVVPELVPYLLSLSAELESIKRGVPVDQAQLEAAVSAAVMASGGSSSSVDQSAPGSQAPPALTGLRAVGSFGSIILSWDAIPYGNHAYTNIYRSVSSTLSDGLWLLNGKNKSFGPSFAVLNAAGDSFTVSENVIDSTGGSFSVLKSRQQPIGTSRHLVYSDVVPNDSKYYYWIRAVSKDGVEGPLNQLAGTLGQSSLDPVYTLDMLAGRVSESELHASLGAKIDGHGVAIEVLDDQYTVKIDVNGHVAGYGLANTSSAENGSESEFIILADRFAVSFPSRPWESGTVYSLGIYVKPSIENSRVYECTAAGTSGGGEPVWPTVIGDTVVDGTVTWTCRGVSGTVPFVIGTVDGQKTVGIRGQLVVDGTITGQKIQADTIGANHISVVDLSALNANMGVLTAGLIQSPDQTFTIDLAQKEIMITGPNGQAGDDYMVLRNGIIEAWKYIAGQHVLGKALTHIESGTANSNTTVQIPGYFESQPNIQVSSRNVQVYSAANSAQDQTLECKATSITEYATGQWQFYAYSALTLAAGSGTQVVNWQNGLTANDTINSTTQTTPANVTDFDVLVGVRSFRGTGTAPNYYYREVDLFLYYRAVGSGVWILGDSFAGFGLPADIENFYGWGLSVSGVAADDYEFYVKAVYSDKAGSPTFASGSGGYEYDSYTTPQVADYASATSPSGGGSTTTNLTVQLASYTPPSGWSIYDVTYSYKYGYYVFAEGWYYWPNDGVGVARVAGISGLNKEVTATGNQFNNYSSNSLGVAGAGNYSSTISFSQASYDRDIFKGGYAYASESNAANANAELRIAEGQAQINIRKAVTNSTTPSNDLKIVEFDYETGAATELSGGTLNWMAIGR